jgi:hypothetical protein
VHRRWRWRGRRDPFGRRRRRLRSRVGRGGRRRRKLIRHHRGGQGRGQPVHGERACRGESGERDDGRAGEHREPPRRTVRPRRRRPSFSLPKSPSHAAHGHGSTLPASVHVCCHAPHPATARSSRQPVCCGSRWRSERCEHRAFASRVLPRIGRCGVSDLRSRFAVLGVGEGERSTTSLCEAALRFGD